MQIQSASPEIVGNIQTRQRNSISEAIAPEQYLIDNRQAKTSLNGDKENIANLRLRLSLAVGQLISCGRVADAERFVTNFDLLALRVVLESSVQGVVGDLQRLEEAIASGGNQELVALRRALQLSESTLNLACDQLPEQLLGRLWSYAPEGLVSKLLLRAASYKSQQWLCPVRTSIEKSSSPLESKIEVHEELVLDAKVDGTGRMWVLTDNQVVQLDIGTPRVHRRFRLNEESPTSLACSRSFVAITTSDGNVLIWELASNGVRYRLNGHLRAALDCTFIDDSTLVTVGTDGKIAIWDTPSGRQLSAFDSGGHSIHSILRIDNTSVVIGCDPRNDSGSHIELWDIKRKSRTCCFGKHDWSVDQLAISPDGATLAAGANDELTIWNLENYQSIRRISTPYSKCHSLGFLTSSLLLRGDSSGELRGWDVLTGIEIPRLPSHSGLVSAISVDPTGAGFVTSSWDQSVRIWNTSRMNTTGEIKHNEQVNCIAVYPDKSRFVSGSQDGSLIVWDVQGGEPMARLVGHGHWVSSVFVGRTIVSSSWDGTIRIWDNDSFGLKKEINSGCKHIGMMACNEDATIAVSVGTDGIVNAWDLETAQQIGKGFSAGEDVNGLAMSSDGHRIRLGTRKRKVIELSSPLGRCNEFVVAGSEPATAWLFNHNYDKFILAAGDGTIDMFEHGGIVKTTFGSQGCGQSALACTQADGYVLAAGGVPQLASDNTARIWRRELPDKPIAKFIVDAPITAGAMINNGYRVLLGDVSGGIHVLTLKNAVLQSAT
jgi:WD40 repeat protein